MAFNLIPTNDRFFEMFQKSAAIILEGSKVLQAISAEPDRVPDHASRMERLEHDADAVTHEVLVRLDRSFITPLDREDIHQLALSLDDCMDFMEAATERMDLYELRTAPPEFKALVEVVAKQAAQIDAMMPLLKSLKWEKINPHCIEINRLENEADKITRGAMAALFKGKLDPLEVMKWRDIYDFLETTTDKCEDVAGIIEGIVLKHG